MADVTQEEMIAAVCECLDSIEDAPDGFYAALRAILAQLEASRQDPRRSGFDVGAGSVREGDEALFEGRKCKVLTVYHDGDVQIELCTYPTVKWRQVTPLPAATTNEGSET